MYKIKNVKKWGFWGILGDFGPFWPFGAHLAAIFCEKKPETVAKHRVTRSKIALFRLAIPKMAGFWKKKWNFRVFWGFGAFPASEFCKVIFGQAPLLRPKIFFLKKNIFFGNSEF